MSATLTISPTADTPASRAVVLACVHGSTEAVIVNGAGLEVVEVQMTLLRHYRVSRCRCTAALRARYGLARVQP